MIRYQDIISKFQIDGEITEVSPWDTEPSTIPLRLCAAERTMCCRR